MVRTAASGGATTVIVPTPAVDDAATAGVRVIGAASLDEALALLTGHWHHPEGCAHCTPDGDAEPHQPCTTEALCPACQESGPAPF